MKLAIMQPYFIPYIGYFQLIANADIFLVYDDVQYMKGGWVNRNRVCDNKYLTLPIENASTFLNINQREISKSYSKEKILNQIRDYYVGSRNYVEAFNLLRECLPEKPGNLAHFLYRHLVTLCEYLEIRTPLVLSSDLCHATELNGKERVKSYCKMFNAGEYLNAIGGMDLYSKQDFWDIGIKLNFLRAKNIMYPRMGKFYPYMSMIDVIFHCKKKQVLEMLKEYEIL